MPDGVTLVIDANTARYIANIARAAEANKHLHKSATDAMEAIHKMGDFAKEAAQTLVGIAIPLTAGSLGISLLEKGTEAWTEQLKEARDILKETQDLYGNFARVGMGKQAPQIEEAMRKASGNLSIPELGGIVSAVTAPGARPDAKEEDFVRAASVGGRAKKAGMNPASFVGMWERLDANGVPNAEDLAFYQQKYIGDDDKFTAAAVKAPGQAADIARYYAGAAAAGDKETKSELRKLVEAWTSFGAQGTFKDFLGSGMAVRTVGGREHMNTLHYLQTHQGPEVLGGTLDRAVRSANANPVTHDKNVNDAVKDATDEVLKSVTDVFGFSAGQRESWDMRKKYVDAKHPSGALGTAWQGLKGGGTDVDSAYIAFGQGFTPEQFAGIYPGIAAKAKAEKEQARALFKRSHPFGGGSRASSGEEHAEEQSRVEQLLREQTVIMQRVRLKPDAQGEGH